jgi:hypothetical protein
MPMNWILLTLCAAEFPRAKLAMLGHGRRRETIGDNDTIIAHFTRKYRLKIDDGPTAAQRDTSHLITRMVDDLYG